MNQRQNANNCAGRLKRFFRSPYLLLTLAPLFWSGNFILGRLVHTTLPPIGLSFWRWLFASLIILFPALPYLKNDMPVIRKNLRPLILLSVLSIATFTALAYMGLRFTTAINGVLIQSALPVIIVIMTYILFRETIRLLQGLGILLSLTGVLVIITRGNPSTILSLSINAGDIMILLAVFCYAAYSALLQKRPPIHQLSFLAVTFIAGTAVLLPFYLLENSIYGSMPFGKKTVLAVGYVAIFPSILSYFCFNRGVELIGANRAGLFIHLMPVFGSIMALFFLGEELWAFHGMGILMILSGIFIVTRVKFRKGKSPVGDFKKLS